MRRTKAGMVLLELLLAIAVVGLITTAGFRAFASLGEVLHRRNLAEVEAAGIALLESRFRRAWDHRLAHRFQTGPWLILEGLPSGDADWVEMESIRLKTVDDDGQTSWWELASSVDLSWMDEPRILVNAGAIGEWAPGRAPALIHLRFPEALFSQNQIGFAVWDVWP
jgi:type II secretory pathway pseudopilin PulG